jgi:hypothetical protein
MPNAANDEHNVAHEASAQQGNTGPSSENESSKPVDPLEVPQHNAGGGKQMQPGQGFRAKGKCTKS